MSLLSDSGIIVLEKPKGETSRKTLNRLQRLVRPVKVGHAGTLDPLAEGVLVACVGKATRLIDVIHLLPKQYTATFLLGYTSDTEDIEGELKPFVDGHVPTAAEFQAVLPRFLGKTRQRPPVYSALKIRGKRACDRTRDGEILEIPPRWVEIFRLNILHYEYPRLSLEVECGSGTYLRSLGRDLAEAVGTGAVMSVLVRDWIGPFRRQDAKTPDDLSDVAKENWRNLLFPLEMAAGHLPRVDLNETDTTAIFHGQKISIPLPVGGEMSVGGETPLAAFDPAQKLVSLLEPVEGNFYKPKVNFF